MRAITFLATPPEDFIGYQLFEKHSDITRERVNQFNILDDDTLVVLSEVRGDLKHLERTFQSSSDVLDYSVPDEDSAGGLVYAHITPPPEIKQLLKLPRKHEVFLESPIEGTQSGRLRFTLIGETDQTVQRAFANIPADITTVVERIGPYPEEGDILSLLTERQTEVLQTAIEEGYYASPREATHQDIAEQMDISAGTVTEHLQKIEARVFGSVVS